MSEPLHNSPSPAREPAPAENQGMAALVRMLRVLFATLKVLIAAALVGVLLEGSFFVEDHQQAMLFRFGKLVAKDGTRILESGKWYWAWPRPVDRVRKIPARRSITVRTDRFWIGEDERMLEDESGGGRESIAPGDLGYVVSGDANIIHMSWSVTYQVSDAERYYLDFYEADEPAGAPPRADQADTVRDREVRALIRALLERAVLQTVATWDVEDVIRTSRPTAAGAREPLFEAVRTNFLARAEELDLGIQVEQLNLVQVLPPISTLEAFREVADAANEHSATIEQAHSYHERTIAEAEGQASRILAEARAYRTRTVESVRAERRYFEKVLAQYRDQPESTLVALYTATLRDVMDAVGDKYVVHSKPDGQQEVRLRLSPKRRKPGQPGDLDAAQAPGDAN